MKKKIISLALASIMAVATLAPMSVSAATSTDTPNQIADYEDGTLIVDNNLGLGAGTSWLQAAITGGADSASIAASDFKDDIGNGGKGSDLVIRMTSPDLTTGPRMFTVTLSGAEFAYLDGNATPVVTGQTKTFASPMASNKVTSAFTFDGLGSPNAPSLGAPTTYGRMQELVYGVGTAVAAGNQIPYYLKISSGNAAEATIIYEGGSATNAGQNGAFFRIPLAMKTKTDGEVSVTVRNQSSNVSDASGIKLASISAGTRTTIASVKTGRSSVKLDTISITENAMGSFKSSTAGTKAYITLEAPSGYKFSNFGAGATNAKLYGDYIGTAVTTTANFTVLAAAAAIPAATANTIEGYVKNDGSEIYIVMPTTSVLSNGRVGVITLKNVELVTYDGDEADWDQELKMAVRNTEAGVTEEEVTVAKFMNWRLLFDAATAPEFFTGYSNKKAATFTWKEQSPDSWWETRETRFTLVDEEGNSLLDKAKITKFEVKTKEINTINNSTAYNSKTTFWNVLNKQGATNNINFSKNGEYFFFEGFESTNNITKKSEMEITPYISVDVNYVGDVYLQASGSGFDDEDINNVRVKIATVKPKVELVSKVTSVQAGFQRYDVADIEVREIEAGALEGGSDKSLKLGLAEFKRGLVSSVQFVPITVNNVSVNGDMKVKLMSTNKVTPTIEFNIDRKSSKASTIKVSGLEVYVDRTVPYGTFELLLKGTSLRNNDYEENTSGSIVAKQGNNDADIAKTGQQLLFRDKFDTAGMIFDEYFNLDTAGMNVAHKNEIKIFSDTDKAIVNGVEITLAAPTINIDGRLYVPLRFVVEQLGADELQDVVWDPVARTATITLNDKTVMWQADSSIYKDMTGDHHMAEAGLDGNIVVSKAVIVKDRMYIPFRYIAYAFNIPVDWDAATGAAIYNKTAE